MVDEIIKLKHGETQERWKTAAADKALVELLKRPLIETRAEHLLRAMELGKVSTNVYLRRIHNFAVDMSWLPAVIIPKRQWPVVRLSTAKRKWPKTGGLKIRFLGLDILQALGQKALLPS